MGLFSGSGRSSADNRQSTDAGAAPVEPGVEALSDRILDTLAGIVRCYGARGFDIEAMSAGELEQRCEAWVRHILTGTPAPLGELDDDEDAQAPPVNMEARQWTDLQQFFRNHRRDEQGAVQERAEGMRGLVSEMTHGLRQAISDDNAMDAQVTQELANLGGAVDSNSLEQVRVQLARTVDVVSQAVHARKARYEAQLESMRERVHCLRNDLVALREKVNLDALTQLHNRGAFDEVLDKQIDFSFLSGQPMALVMIDIDHFKAINDAHGHPGGDVVLQMVAKTLHRQFPRRSDFIARYGGEEFALILVDADLAALEKLAGRVLASVRELVIDYLDNDITVTCSIGIAACYPEDTAETLVLRADQALYQAKDAGRDTFIIAD